jgi:Protein of unknown function (DUF3108)
MRLAAMNRSILLLAALVSGVALGAPPKRVALEYEMSRNGMVIAVLKETLEHDGASYRIVSEGRGKGIFALLARGSIVRTSEGAIAADGLRPREYQDRRGNNTSSAKFDWSGRTLVQEKNGKSETQPLPEHAQDRLSFLWGFAFALPGKASFDAMVADGRGAPVRYRYAVAGNEVLKTPLGNMATVHLVKQREPGDSRQTEVWLAVKRTYVPVRVLVVEKDGTRLDQVVTRIDG